MNTYEVRFRARLSDALADDAVERLHAALEGMPGISRAAAADHDRLSGTVTGEFEVEVAKGMAAAARDSSRLAKEALNAAGMGEARLVELFIALRQS
jgi:hypothetical protein